MVSTKEVIAPFEQPQRKDDLINPMNEIIEDLLLRTVHSLQRGSRMERLAAGKVLKISSVKNSCRDGCKDSRKKK